MRFRGFSRDRLRPTFNACVGSAKIVRVRTYVREKWSDNFAPLLLSRSKSQSILFVCAAKIQPEVEFVRFFTDPKKIVGEDTGSNTIRINSYLFVTSIHWRNRTTENKRCILARISGGSLCSNSIRTHVNKTRPIKPRTNCGLLSLVSDASTKSCH